MVTLQFAQKLLKLELSCLWLEKGGFLCQLLLHKQPGRTYADPYARQSMLNEEEVDF